MKKRLIIALALLVLFSTYKSPKIFLSNKFTVKEIKIENNFILKKEIIKRDLSFIYDSNLIFLNNLQIEEKIKKIDFIESLKIKKIYPNKLKITVYEKKPIAVLQHKREKYYISENIDLIKYLELENYKDLPIVFGNKENFSKLYKNLKKISFPLDLIAKYYLYESKRWDIETNNQITIKLPTKNYIKGLKNFMDLSKDNNFDKYKVFDYRINNQLILK
jgi:cell division protein FtsQ